MNDQTTTPSHVSDQETPSISSAAEIKKANKNILALAGLFAMAAARDGGCIEIADGVFLNCHRYLVESEDWDAEVASQAPFWITDTNLDQIPVQDEHDGRLLEIIREAAQTTHARGRF